MRYEKIQANVNNAILNIELQFWEENDRRNLKHLFNLWKMLNDGMKLIRSRGINLPEGISESAFCLDFMPSAGRALKG